MLRAGDELNGYRIVAPLRSGGMARLYLARRQGVAGFARAAAIKVIHPHLARERRFVDLFVAEARLSSMIEDPNVVRVEELGETDGVLFLAMEYVHGVSLSELIKALGDQERRLSFDAVAHVGARVATALHAAHETSDANGKRLGIVHCDVSPQNVLISFGGHVKLIDFGVARALGATDEASQLSVRGKLAYMAPEQAAGRRPDRRTDVYALGIVLWELLTLERAFDASNDVALMALVKDGAVVSPRAHAPHVPEALAAVVMKALAKDPADRYATAQDLARALADAVPGSRSLEADEVGQLVQAAMPDEARKKDALLALAVPDALGAAGIDRIGGTDGIPGRSESADAGSAETSPFRRPKPSLVALEHLTLPVAERPEALGVPRERVPRESRADTSVLLAVPAADAHPDAAVTTEMHRHWPTPLAVVGRPAARRWPWVPAIAALVVLSWLVWVQRSPQPKTDTTISMTTTTTDAPVSAALLTSLPAMRTGTDPSAAAPPPTNAVEDPPSTPKEAPPASAPTLRAPHRAKAATAPRPPSPVAPSPPTSAMRCRIVGGVELCQ